MQMKSWFGGLAVGGAALALCAGCEAQVGEGYQGEAMLTLQGSVELGENPAPDQVPVLAFRSDNGFVVVDAHVAGQFPAHFQMSVFDPPPANARKNADGTVSGFLTVLPKDHPSEIPAVSGGGIGTDNADGSRTEQLDMCTADQICRHEVYSCAAQQQCPVVGETGDAIVPSQVTMHSSEGEGGDEHLMDFVEDCNADHECHRLFRECDLDSTYLPFLLAADFGYTSSCTFVSATGDARVQTYEAVQKRATGYRIVYSQEDRASWSDAYPLNGPLPAGYTLFREVEPPAEQWIASIDCVRDSADPSGCPQGIHNELVGSDEQLTLRLGYGND